MILQLSKEIGSACTATGFDHIFRLKLISNFDFRIILFGFTDRHEVFARLIKSIIIVSNDSDDLEDFIIFGIHIDDGSKNTLLRGQFLGCTDQRLFECLKRIFF